MPSPEPYLRAPKRGRNASNTRRKDPEEGAYCVLNPNRSEVLEKAFRACLEAGCSPQAAFTFVQGISPLLSDGPVPPAMRLFPENESHETIKKRLMDGTVELGAKLTAEIRASCANCLVTVSFDGGRLVRRTAHYVCMMVHVGTTTYCVPFTAPREAGGPTFDSEILFEAIKGALSKIGLSVAHVRHIVSDAAIGKTSTGDRIGDDQLTAEDLSLAAFAMTLDDSDFHLDVDPEFLDAIDAVARHHAFNNQPRYHKCIAHQLLLVVHDSVNDPHWGAGNAALDFIRATKAFFRFSDRSSRFEEFLAARRTPTLQRAIQQLEVIGAGLSYADSAVVEANLRGLLESLGDDFKYLNGFLPTEAEITAEHISRIIAECRRIAATDTAPIAYCNGPWWHQATYHCAKFGFHNLSAIVDFALAEGAKPTLQWHKVFAELHGATPCAAERRHEVRKELLHYVEAFAPVRGFIADFASYQPFEGTKIFHRLQHLERRLADAAAPGSKTVERSSVVLQKFESRKRHMNIKFWQAVSCLHPMCVSAGVCWMRGEAREREVQNICSILRSEFHVAVDQQAEFDQQCRMYIDRVNAMTVAKLQSLNLLEYWRQFPNGVLKTEALVALSVPPVVTLRDPESTIQAALFNVREDRMSHELAIAYLTVRLNGPDFTFGKADTAE